jgi:hypothetical protein
MSIFASVKKYSQKMKRLILASIALMMCILAQAQVKVLPKMNVGDKYVYDIVTKSNHPAMKFTANSSMQFYVSEKTKNGYVIDMKMTSLDNDSENIKFALMMNLTEGMLKDVNIRIEVDKKGQPIRVVNFDEVKENASKYIKNITDLVYADDTDLSDMMPKEEFLKTAMSTVNEETLMEGITKTASNPLSINGKTYTEGMEESFINPQGLKIKRIYHIEGKNKFSSKGETDMSNEDMKAFIIKKVEESMPERAEMVKSSLDMLIATGMMKLEAVENNTYELQNNGWLKAVDMDMKLSMMGQNITVTSHSELKR